MDIYPSTYLEIINNNLEITKCKLYLNKMTSSQRHFFGFSAGNTAVQYGHLEIVKFFIQYCDVDPNSRDISGYDYLQIASKSGYLEIVKYLIQNHYANPYGKYDGKYDGKNNSVYNAIQLAFKFHHLDIMMYFIKMGFLHDTVDLYLTLRLMNNGTMYYLDEKFCKKFYTKMVLQSVGLINIYGSSSACTDTILD